MEITKERYLELGLNLCKEDCYDCMMCYEKNGEAYCEELPEDVSIDDAIKQGYECPELDYDRLKEEMSEEEYDAWRHGRLNVEE